MPYLLPFSTHYLQVILCKHIYIYLQILFRELRDSECKVKCKSRKSRIMCGSDGVSYQSKCELKRARRCEGKHITIRKKGKCSGKWYITCHCGRKDSVWLKVSGASKADTVTSNSGSLIADLDLKRKVRMVLIYFVYFLRTLIVFTSPTQLTNKQEDVGSNALKEGMRQGYKLYCQRLETLETQIARFWAKKVH